MRPSRSFSSIASWADRISHGLVSGLVVLLVGGCVGLQQYHDTAPVETASPSDLECKPGEKDLPDRKGWKCGDAYFENRAEYLLGFVEFDDLGWAWDKAQQEALLEAIDGEIEQRDALIVVFAHGWKHNASTCDNNVTCFRATLDNLYQTELALSGGAENARRVIGVYVGWRGDSARGKLLRQTTFFGRKSTAHKVGSGAVTELLVRLKELRSKAARLRSPTDTRLVIVGHSFGGALIFSATSQLVAERLAISAARGDAVDGFADLVVLVNPAFEAALYQPLHQAVLDRAKAKHENGTVGFDTDQKPVFVVVTSRTDSATGTAFPIGRFFSAKLFDDYRTGPKRAEQQKANQKAVGHFAPYRTHFLNSNDLTPPVVTANKAVDKLCRCPYALDGMDVGPRDETQDQEGRRVEGNMADLRQAIRELSPVLEFPTSTLVWDTEGKGDNQTPYNAPVMVIETQPTIIARHSDIYQPAFVDFLRYLIMMAGDEVEYGRKR